MRRPRMVGLGALSLVAVSPLVAAYQQPSPSLLAAVLVLAVAQLLGAWLGMSSSGLRSRTVRTLLGSALAVMVPLVVVGFSQARAARFLVLDLLLLSMAALVLTTPQLYVVDSVANVRERPSHEATDWLVARCGAYVAAWGAGWAALLPSSSTVTAVAWAVMLIGLVAWLGATLRRYLRRRWWRCVVEEADERFAVVNESEAKLPTPLIPVLATRVGRRVLVRRVGASYRRDAAPVAIARACRDEPLSFFDLLWDVLERPGRYPQNPPTP